MVGDLVIVIYECPMENKHGELHPAIFSIQRTLTLIDFVVRFYLKSSLPTTA